MKRSGFIIAVFLSLLLSVPVCAGGRENWTSIRSPQFLVVGNARESEMRQVALYLEQMRAAFSQLLAQDRFESSLPVTIIVFKDDDSYRPFKPLFGGQPADVSGYFQSSPDADYITLSVDQHGEISPVVFHEYVHLLVKNRFRSVPLWFNEGLAEYYSTFELSKSKRKVILGKAVRSRLPVISERQLLPLKSLFSVNTDSPYYNEQEKRSLFYAQSWALVHYLLSGSQQRRQQLASYLDRLAAGLPQEDAFRQVFQTNYEGLELELANYVHMGRYPEQVINLDKEVASRIELQAKALTEAEAEYYLGDLLLHANRLDEAEAHLQRAIALNPDAALAHASLGDLRMRQKRFAEAKQHLQKAVAQAPQNYLVHYHYAYSLSREGMETDGSIDGYAPESAALMRDELKRVIELEPNFVEAYRLLAFVHLVTNQRLDEAAALVKRALVLAPERKEFSLLLAQVYLHQDEFDAARQVLNDLMSSGPEPQLLGQAQSLLASVSFKQQVMAQLKLDKERQEKEETPPGAIQPCDAPQPGAQIKRLRFDGEQVCGRLLEVDCTEAGVLLLVEAGNRTLKLHSRTLNRIRFVTYTSDVKGAMTCGQLNPATPVLVTYHSPKEVQAQTDGEVIAVEFLPKDWN